METMANGSNHGNGPGSESSSFNRTDISGQREMASLCIFLYGGLNQERGGRKKNRQAQDRILRIGYLDSDVSGN